MALLAQDGGVRRRGLLVESLDLAEFGIAHAPVTVTVPVVTAPLHGDGAREDAHDGDDGEDQTSDNHEPTLSAWWRSTVRIVDEHSDRRFGAAEQAAEWDARYGEHDGAMWSGRPNGRLVAEAADLTPGGALDVGCGEDVAVRRAREAAERAGVAVEWVCGDALRTSFAADSHDLVSLQYPALPKIAGEAAVRRLLDTVRPGGLLLAVYHDLDHEHREHMKSQGFDPADYVGVDDLVPMLGDDFTVERHAVEPRIDPPPGTPHIADVVLRARRAAARSSESS
jgi:SAM-dependent methyltransferase